MNTIIKFKKTDPRAIIPQGPMDFYLSAILEHDCFIPQGDKYLFSTGLAFDIPEEWKGEIHPYDEISRNNGAVCSLKTITSEYKDEVFVCLYNHSFSTLRVKHGMRIAQIVFKQCPQVTLELVDALKVTERGEKGFGSSGV